MVELWQINDVRIVGPGDKMHPRTFDRHATDFVGYAAFDQNATVQIEIELYRVQSRGRWDFELLHQIGLLVGGNSENLISFPLRHAVQAKVPLVVGNRFHETIAHKVQPAKRC